jgi:hypothetical protein
MAKATDKKNDKAQTSADLPDKKKEPTVQEKRHVLDVKESIRIRSNKLVREISEIAGDLDEILAIEKRSTGYISRQTRTIENGIEAADAAIGQIRKLIGSMA